MALVFDKCCFCIDLKTGCFIIGYLNLIAEIVLILLGIFGLAGGAVITAQSEEEGAQVLGTVLVVVVSIFLILMFLFLAFTIVLLVGLHKERRGHIKAYLIYTLIFLVIAVIGFFVTIGSGGAKAGSIVSTVLNILLNIYFLLVIRSYYIKMDDPSKRPAVYSTA